MILLWEGGIKFIYYFCITNIGKVGYMDNTSFGTSKIDSRNRIVLSRKVMDFLKLSPGDLVSIEKNDDKLILLKAYIYVRRNAGGGNAVNKRTIA